MKFVIILAVAIFAFAAVQSAPVPDDKPVDAPPAPPAAAPAAPEATQAAAETTTAPAVSADPNGKPKEVQHRRRRILRNRRSPRVADKYTTQTTSKDPVQVVYYG
ncbi:cyclic di-GMP-binding protein-like isoform X1 [Leguminivora glycinivorella]|uniref:cyclic di-GMP-binding protein-like isoform X1 n=1 Tax=Leguminivora glycinivorella TaxID=1035111 RepID=UPI00200E7AC2|nr:cyclic di-GMP-binding protein-like isoform X1 [Leguminivora glycinivorella]